MNRSRGMTLIELLVAVFAFAVLATSDGRAIDEEHAYGAALLSLAGAYERRGEHQASLEALERVERNHGPSPESAYRRGRALAALGRREQARAALAEVSSLAKSAARYQARDGQAWALRAYWTGLRV